MASIRERLRAYFDGDGRDERWVLSVPKGRYRAVFTEHAPAPPSDPPAERHPALRRFWAPYLAPGGNNVITYTEPLFFKDPQGVYLRNIYVNDRTIAEEELYASLPVPPGTPLEACYHYLSSGEMQASVSLVRAFGDLGAPLDLRNARRSSLTELRHANLILLGSVRTNHLIDSLMGGPGFVMTRDALENRDARPGEESVYRGTRYMDGKLPRFTDYAVVTRRRGLASGSTLTIISSHHGRAVQGVGTVLTLEDRVASLLASMGMEGEGALPEHFQLLLQVEMMDLDAEVVDVRYLTHRIHEP
jgi:hypothetical protein